jgi:hypothetical protein
MTGGTVAPFVIAPVALVLLALWIAMVYWAGAHPAHQVRGAHRGLGAHEGHGGTQIPGTTRAREDAAVDSEDEDGAQAPPQPGRRAA